MSAKLLLPVLDILAPDSCMACGCLGSVVCDDCLPKLRKLKQPTCYNCNRPSANFSTCTTCQKHSHIKRIVVASHYQGDIQSLIYKLKYSNSISAATPLAKLINMAHKNIADRYDLLVPAPTSNTNLRHRGYCQARLITQQLSRLTGVKSRDCLRKYGSTRQVGADKVTRQKQVRNSIYATNRSKNEIKGKRILLVDDVLTTGATLNESAKVLRSLGASRIEAVVVAKH